MDNRLIDYLTQLYNADMTMGRNQMQRARIAESVFSNYVQSVGIEVYNFGAFEVDDSGVALNNLTGSNMSEAWLEEYFDRELYENDIIMRRAATLGSTRQHDIFRFGSWMKSHLPSGFEMTGDVLAGCADAGMKDAIGMIGRSAIRPDSNSQRFYAIGLGGAIGTGNLVKSNLSELQIAIFSLLDHLRPILEAQLDRANIALSPKEQRILQGLANGNQRSQLAFDSNISKNTVDFHLQNLKHKLRAQTLAECVGKGYRYGLID